MIVSNEELEHILKVFKSFEESGLSKKCATNTITKEVK